MPFSQTWGQRLQRVVVDGLAVAAAAACGVATAIGLLRQDPGWPALAALAVFLVRWALRPLRCGVGPSPSEAHLHETAARATAFSPLGDALSLPPIGEGDLRGAAALLGTGTLGVLVHDPSRRQRLPSGDLLLLSHGKVRAHRVPLAGDECSGGLGFLAPPGVIVPRGAWTKPLMGQAGEVGRLLLDRGAISGTPTEAMVAVLGALWALRIDNQRLAADARARLLDVVESLVASVEAKDIYTSGHSKRVCRYSVLLARQLGLADAAVDDVAIGAALHDVGKLGIPESVLGKASALDEAEWALVRSHPKVGARIIDSFNQSPAVLHAIFHHHERYDGRGYPARLAGDAIPLAARIVGVADALDAMTSARTYQRNRTVGEALEELRRNAGTQFDPLVVRAAQAIPLERLTAVAPPLPVWAPAPAPASQPIPQPAPPAADPPRVTAKLAAVA